MNRENNKWNREESDEKGCRRVEYSTVPGVFTLALTEDFFF